jgi:hypothetical protein
MPQNIFILLICSLAVFRLAEFVVADDGPFFIMRGIRKTCAGHPAWCKLLTCFYCVSAYWALLLTWLLQRVEATKPIGAIIWWAGIWGGAAFIFRIVRERKS